MVKLNRAVYDAVTECIHISQTNANLLVKNGQQGVKDVEE